MAKKQVKGKPIPKVPPRPGTDSAKPMPKGKGKVGKSC